VKSDASATLLAAASEVISFWAEWMIPMAWQATLLILLAALIDRLLDRAGWPELRHGLWLLVALKLLIPPGLASPWSLVSRWRGSTEWAGALDTTGRHGSDIEFVSEAVPALAPSPSWATIILFVAWALGAAVSLVLTASRTRRFNQRMLAGSRRPSERVRRVAESAIDDASFQTPRVLISKAARTPFVRGLIHPTIVLPVDAEEWSSTDLRHVFLHELAHIQRRDLWFQSLFTLLSGIYWFHPLVALAHRRAHRAREIAADAHAARRLGDTAPDYQATLTRIAHATLLTRHPEAVGFLGSESITLARLRALDRMSWQSSLGRRLAAFALLLTLAIFVLPMAPHPGSAVTSAARELERAQDAFSSIAADDANAGSLHYRYAVLQLQAAAKNLEQAQHNELKNEGDLR